MGKVIPITEQFQHFISELKESFWGDLLRGIALCLDEAPQRENLFERPDRLAGDADETEARATVPPRDFLRHVLESWVLAQHVYWFVGRGLADAHAQGKTLLRLKVVLDEGGWAAARSLCRIATCADARWARDDGEPRCGVWPALTGLLAVLL